MRLIFEWFMILSSLGYVGYMSYILYVYEPRQRKEELALFSIVLHTCSIAIPYSPAERDQYVRAVRRFLYNEYTSPSLPYGETHRNFYKFICSDTALGLVEGVTHLCTWKEFVEETLQEALIKEEY